MTVSTASKTIDETAEKVGVFFSIIFCFLSEILLDSFHFEYSFQEVRGAQQIEHVHTCSTSIIPQAASPKSPKKGCSSYQTKTAFMRKVEHFNVDYGHLLLWLFDVSGRAVTEQSRATAEPCRDRGGFFFQSSRRGGSSESVHLVAEKQGEIVTLIAHFGFRVGKNGCFLDPHVKDVY